MFTGYCKGQSLLLNNIQQGGENGPKLTRLFQIVFDKSTFNKL